MLIFSPDRSLKILPSYGVKWNSEFPASTWCFLLSSECESWGFDAGFGDIYHQLKIIRTEVSGSLMMSKKQMLARQVVEAVLVNYQFPIAEGHVGDLGPTRSWYQQDRVTLWEPEERRGK